METSCKKRVFCVMLAILLCEQSSLFAQSSHLDPRFQELQRSTQHQFGEFANQRATNYGWVWIVGSIAVFSACTYLFYLWFQQTQVGKPSSTLDSPKALFRELVSTHELTWAQSRFLQNLATDLRLPDPCLIFVEPLCLEAAQRLPQYSRQQLELRTLEERFFGTTVTLATEMSSSATSILRNEYLPEMGAAMAEMTPTEYISGEQTTMVKPSLVYPSSYTTNVADAPTETMNSTMLWDTSAATSAADQTTVFHDEITSVATFAKPSTPSRNKTQGTLPPVTTVQQAISLIAAHQPATSTSTNTGGISDDQVTTVIPPLFRSGDPTKLRREHLADLGREQNRMEELFGQDQTEVYNVIPSTQKSGRVEEPLNEKLTQYLVMGMENTRAKPAFLESR